MEGGWQDHLHWIFLGEHVLVAGLHLDTGRDFFIASCLTACICFSERVLTYATSKRWNPFVRGRRSSRLGTSLWRTCLYWLVTFDRLLYMLIGMTFSFGLIIVAVTCLAIGQFVIEYLEWPLLPSPTDDHYHDTRPSMSYPPAPASSRPIVTRPRSKSKPEDIFIHPNDSNLARADAAALELGLTGDTERVKANMYPADEDPWEHGKGRDVARELLLGR
ncbi:hypothetical protein C8Q79DRAFT_1020757 [Trametes meyenii]|nr:hypothetical protein C8Q79DRAFT_1020757 [Trametes meyenii]